MKESIGDAGWEIRLKKIKEAGEADLAAGKIIDMKTVYLAALHLAEIYERRDKEVSDAELVLRLKAISPDPQYREAVKTLGFMVKNGKSLSDAMSFRPAVFNAEMIAAVKAGEKDGNLPEHLLSFIKYRELLGRLNELFENRDFKGLEEWLHGKT
jgi:hypothetical protein